MGVTLSLTVTESSVSQANNTSVVKAVLKAKTTSTSYNHNSPYGYIMIDGTKYGFNHSFDAGTTTILATKSKTITHNSDGSKSITVKGYLQSGISSGNVSTSKTVTLTKIVRQFTVAYSSNGGSGAPSSQTKTYGTTLTLSSIRPTRAGYIFKGWATSSTGSVAYQPGGSYTSNSAITLYAVWEAVNYTISFDVGEGTGEFPQITKPHNVTISLPSNEPTRYHYAFIGWRDSEGLIYNPGAPFNNNCDEVFTAVWSYVYKFPTLKILEAYRTNSTTDISEVPTGTCFYIKLEWSCDESWGPPTLDVKMNGESLPKQILEGVSGVVIYKGTGLSKNTTGVIEAKITDRSGITVPDGIGEANAVIGKSIVPFRLKPDAAEFGAGAWFGGEIRVGGGGFHHNGSMTLMDFIYPVGSIYMTSDSEFDPNTWTGENTWEKVEGRFLLGSSDEYAVGDTGGESEHKLTISEMPSHTHIQNEHRHSLNRNFSDGSGGSTSAYTYDSNRKTSTKYTTYTTATNQNTGGSLAHNNMPPYEVVNIWKRIA